MSFNLRDIGKKRLVFLLNFGFGKMKDVVYFFTSNCMSKKAVVDATQFKCKSTVAGMEDNATDVLIVGIYSSVIGGRI